MFSARQIQKFWDERRYDKLISELLFARVESTACVQSRLSGSTAAAALGLIRLEELGQAGHPLAKTLLRCLLASQGAGGGTDGGWNDPMLCALCVRALATAGGQGLAIDCGIRFLADLQKTEGIWPRESLRRLPADALTSAFILLQLGKLEAFRQSVRFDDALVWFEENAQSVEPDVAKLAHHAMLRSRVAPSRSGTMSWS